MKQTLNNTPYVDYRANHSAAPQPPPYRGERPLVKLYTDGACPANGPDKGEGGWAVVMQDAAGNQRSFGGYEHNSASNRMELRAVLEGIARLKKPCQVLIITDSKNVIGWLWGWDTVKDVPSREHAYRMTLPIREYIEQIQRALVDGKHQLLEPLWVRGHAGHRENELADQIAVYCRKNRIVNYDDKKGMKP